MKIPKFLVENITVSKPDMWLVNNDKLHLHIYRHFRIIERSRKDGINENQKGATLVENGYVYRETFIRITNIEDRDDYYYISFKPVGRDSGRCGWGCFRLYKNAIPEYGVISLEDITNTININTGEAK